MSVSINKKLNIYNKHKEQLELDALSSGDTVICLLKCKKIVFYKIRNFRKTKFLGRDYKTIQ